MEEQDFKKHPSRTNAESKAERSHRIGSLVDSEERRGIITFIDHGKMYGFIQSDEGLVTFFHAYDCLNRPLNQFRTGTRVSFLLANSDKGNKTKAIGVTAL